MELKTIRNNNNLTQKQLSELTGIPHRTLQRIEEKNDCKVSTAIKLAKALNVSLDELCLSSEDE